MSRSQSYGIKSFILTHAWLNLWDERMTTGRINQVATAARSCSPAFCKAKKKTTHSLRRPKWKQIHKQATFQSRKGLFKASKRRWLTCLNKVKSMNLSQVARNNSQQITFTVLSMPSFFGSLYETSHSDCQQQVNQTHKNVFSIRRASSLSQVRSVQSLIDLASAVQINERDLDRKVFCDCF